MTRAEEAALKAYPVKMVSGPIGYEEPKFDINGLARSIFIEGYEQAEKDLLANAVDGDVWESSGGLKTAAVGYKAIDEKLKNFTRGEKLKIIIIKDDESIND